MDILKLGDIAIRWKELARDVRLSDEKRTSCADAKEFAGVLTIAVDLIAAYSNVPRDKAMEIMAALVALEVGYPDRQDVYRNDFWETSRSFRGVTQASSDNWTDSRDIARFLAPSVTSATLLHQLLAVWAYVKRGCALKPQRVRGVGGEQIEFVYKDLPLTPVVVYVVHQQGYGVAVPLLFSVRDLAGRQSAKSVNFINNGLAQVRAGLKL